MSATSLTWDIHVEYFYRGVPLFLKHSFWHLHFFPPLLPNKVVLNLFSKCHMSLKFHYSVINIVLVCHLFGLGIADRVNVISPVSYVSFLSSSSEVCFLAIQLSFCTFIIRFLSICKRLPWKEVLQPLVNNCQFDRSLMFGFCYDIE